MPTRRNHRAHSSGYVTGGGTKRRYRLTDQEYELAMSEVQEARVEMARLNAERRARRNASVVTSPPTPVPSTPSPPNPAPPPPRYAGREPARPAQYPSEETQHRAAQDRAAQLGCPPLPPAPPARPSRARAALGPLALSFAGTGTAVLGAWGGWSLAAHDPDSVILMLPAALCWAVATGGVMVMVAFLASAVRAARGIGPSAAPPLPSADDPPTRSPEPTHLSREHLQARHHQLSVEYGTFLTDPRAVLARPALNDLSDPLTAELVEAYADLTALPDNIALPQYQLALDRAWKSWRAADTNATRLGLSHLSERERKALLSARALIDLALDPAATEPERASAYARAGKLLEGLVVLPAPALAQLEASVRPQIEAS